MKRNIELCIGCQGYCHSTYLNYPEYKDIDGKVLALCPCINCIVKPMCQTGCDAFKKFESKRLSLRGHSSDKIYRMAKVGKNLRVCFL